MDGWCVLGLGDLWQIGKVSLWIGTALSQDRSLARIYLDVFHLPLGLSAVPKLCACVPYLSTMKAGGLGMNDPQRETARHPDLSGII